MKIFYKILYLLNLFTNKQMRKLEEKAERNAKEKERTIPTTQECTRCKYEKYVEGNCILETGSRCYLNPLKPINLGLMANHSIRSRKLSEVQEDEY